jgi:hypothetical protein
MFLRMLEYEGYTWAAELSVVPIVEGAPMLEFSFTRPAVEGEDFRVTCQVRGEPLEALSEHGIEVGEDLLRRQLALALAMAGSVERACGDGPRPKRNQQTEELAVAATGRMEGIRMKKVEQRLLVEVAIAERLPVRLESRVGAGRTTTRIVRPVALEDPAGTTEGAGILIARSAVGHESRIDLDEVDEVSLVTTGLQPEAERQGEWHVGDAVRDAELGVGIVQAFRARESRWDAVVRFAGKGPQRLTTPLPGSHSSR